MTSHDVELRNLNDRPSVEVEYKVTWVRWYILVIHALVGLGQCLVYSTWGAIAISAEQAFGLTQLDFGLLPNWYNISYFISIFPFMWMVQNTGLRSAELLTAMLTAAGATIRCLNFGNNPDQYRYIIHFGQFINGLASPLPWMGCTYISAIWFPPNERTLATSLGLAASGIGTALSNVIGPMFVHAMAPGDNPTDEELYDAIRSLLWFEALLCQIFLVMVIWYFPSRPKIPPSFTAGEERTPFGQGLRDLLSSYQTWLMLGVYAISSSVFASWQQFLTIFVSPIMDEVEAGWLGFTIQILGIVSGPALSATSTWWIEKHSKLVCISLMLIGCAAIAVMTFTAFLFPDMFSSVLMWISMVILGTTITAAQPVWWEMSCEAAYPVAESVVSGVFTLANCVISWVYFTLYMFPQLGTDWATWSFLIAELLSIPALLFYKPSNKRSQLDQATPEEQTHEHRRNTLRIEQELHHVRGQQSLEKDVEHITFL